MDTPFAEYKATELPLEKINRYFVEPKYISKMYTNNVAFIIGQRGTGKTTLLKHLCASYNENNGKGKTRIGVYYRFDINKMHSFSGAALSSDSWESLFAHCFSIEMCLELTKLLIYLRDNYPLEHEARICKRIRHMFFDESEINVQSLEDLREYLENIDYISKRYKRNPLRAPAPMISECEKAFEEFCSLISQERAYKNVCVHFLFDEYENMLDYQKEFINSCAKNASHCHTYKICVRPYGNSNMKTKKSSETLNEADDFKTLDYISDIIGDADDVAEFMRKACERRLREYYRMRNTPFTEDDLKIEKYFQRSKSDDELFAQLSKNTEYVESVQNEVIAVFRSLGADYQEDWDLLQMKLFLALQQKRDFNLGATINSIANKDARYRNWLNNYKKSILFLCFSETNSQYEMSGFKDILAISGNVVRYVFEICDYSFLCTNYSSDGKFSAISEKMQTEATYKVSQRRFQQISTIAEYGQEIKQMVLAIGKIFNMYHRDSQLKRFEPNHFSIERRELSTKYLESKVQKAIQLSVMQGVFIAERSTKNRGGSDVPIEDEDFHLHPILTPYFQISWRKKQKCRFTFSEIESFLFGSDEKISEILNGYSKKTSSKKGSSMRDDDGQLSFADMKKQCY